MAQEKISVDLFVTDSAAHQILLMKENDFTLSKQEFRISIKGKGCHGFDYACGFSLPLETDMVVEVPVGMKKIKILMDPFVAFYCQKMKIDYLLNTETNEEGFILDNLNQESYQGKFYKDPSKVPTHINL